MLLHRLFSSGALALSTAVFFLSGCVAEDENDPLGDASSSSSSTTSSTSSGADSSTGSTSSSTGSTSSTSSTSSTTSSTSSTTSSTSSTTSSSTTSSSSSTSNSSSGTSSSTSSSGGMPVFTFCAEENGTCYFPGTKRIRYGADGAYNYLVASDSIECNNSTFGDPIVGTLKQCYYEDVSPGSSSGGDNSSNSTSSSSSSSSSTTTSSSSGDASGSSSSNSSTSTSSSSGGDSSSSSTSSTSTSSTGSSSSSSSSSSGVPVGDAALGATQYVSMCQGCHQEQGTGTNTVPDITATCSNANCQDPAELSSFIDANMPPFGEGCVGECADNVAAYVIEVLQTQHHTSETPSGSWNVDTAQCEMAVPVGSQRLLPTQIANALVSVFGSNINANPGYPAPDNSVGFSTSVEANRAARGDIRMIAESADTVVLSILDRLPALANCGNAVNDECARTYIDTVAPTIYRGVYQTQDINHLQNLYSDLRSGALALAPDVALAGALSAMIQSPAFLYLLELGEANGTEGERRLTAREIANRMAFLLTGSPPDDALLASASNGQLLSADGREQHVDRLLGAEGSMLNSFFREWLGVAGVDLSGRLSPAENAAFNGEFDRLVAQAVGSNQSVSSLFSRDTTFVNQTLSSYYGLNSYGLNSDAANDDSWLEVPVDANRGGGLLSTALVATAHSSLGGTSIVKRGRFVREGLLCYELGNPPPGAIDLNPVLPEDATIRERSEARSAIQLCSTCHTQMDPIGIGMEDINDLGQLRTIYDLSGHPVDSDGVLDGLLSDVLSNQTQDVSFNGTAELGSLLSNSPAITMCAREQWFTYAMGDSDVSQCHSALVGDPGTTSDSPEKLLRDLIRSPSFILRSDDAQSDEGDQ